VKTVRGPNYEILLFNKRFFHSLLIKESFT
jgi:hypothetical protein